MVSTALNMRTEVLLVVTPFIPVGRQWEQITLSLYREHFPELHPIHPRKGMLSKDKKNYNNMFNLQLYSNVDVITSLLACYML